MNNYRFFNKLLALLALVGAIMAIYLLWARPYQMHWGATAAEISRPMPGDELDPAPTFLATRAITINGTPEEIWPWLVQMGYGRAGFYGYDILENIGSERGLRSAEQIVPELQNFNIGDAVPLSAVAQVVFYALEPNQYVIWRGERRESPGGFTWALYPVDEDQTRLVSRIRWSHHWTQPGVLAFDLFTEFADYLAVREVLLGVKGRVEGQIEPMAQQNIEFGIYLSTCLIWLASMGLLLVQPLTWRRWFAGVAAGLVWLFVWYMPMSILLGTLLPLATLWALWQAFRPEFQPKALAHSLTLL